MSNSTEKSVVLSNLLPSTGYLLSYSLPLLFISIILTFAGAFLTLDRTRSFPPRYDSVGTKKAHKFYRLLQGGVGGLAIGYAFGVHLSTFLSLIIPSLSSFSSLSPKSYLAIWFLSTTVTTLLAGRWQFLALAFSGISGGGTAALSISVIIHPSLSARIIFTGIVLPVIALLTVLPFSKTQHSMVRFSASATGAFGIILSIALLSHVASWATVWERLWKRDGESWGSGKEKGLSAAWCLFLILGVCVDWLLKKRFGENPDEKWDHYLANYSANLPNFHDRAGTFKPLSNSFWNGVFGRPKHTGNVDILFPADKDLKAGSTSHSALAKNRTPQSSQPFNFQPNPAHLKKGQSQRHGRFKAGRKRERIKFGTYLDSSDSDDSDDLQTPLATSENARPWLKEKRSVGSDLSGTVTLNGTEDAKKSENGAPDYSDHEGAVSPHVDRIKRRVSREGAGWRPEFLVKHRNAASGSSLNQTTLSQTPLGAVPVPATPSLLKAIERVAVAQREAFTSRGKESGLPDTNSSAGRTEERAPKTQEVLEPGQQIGGRWQEFWREVKVKAGQ